MILRAFVLTLCFAVSAPLFAQAQGNTPQRRGDTPHGRGDTPQAAKPVEQSTPAPPVVAIPRRQGQPVNIKVDVTITDQRAGSPALKKTVSVVTGDGLNGFIRSTANYTNLGLVPLNVDTSPELLTDGKVRVSVNLQYDLPGSVAGQSVETPGAGALRVTQIRENLAVILENGKPIVAAQSADPVGDRQVTIEIKATILK